MIGGDKGGDSDLSEFFQSICRQLFKVEPKKPSLPPARLYFKEDDINNLRAEDVRLVKPNQDRK